MTTGAGMWLAGAVGLSIGFGFWWIAAFATGASLIVLFILGRLEVALQWKVPEPSGENSTAKRPEDSVAAGSRER